jgi:hypothetical protein
VNELWVCLGLGEKKRYKGWIGMHLIS